VAGGRARRPDDGGVAREDGTRHDVGARGRGGRGLVFRVGSGAGGQDRSGKKNRPREGVPAGRRSPSSFAQQDGGAGGPETRGRCELRRVRSPVSGTWGGGLPGHFGGHLGRAAGRFSLKLVRDQPGDPFVELYMSARRGPGRRRWSQGSSAVERREPGRLDGNLPTTVEPRRGRVWRIPLRRRPEDGSGRPGAGVAGQPAREPGGRNVAGLTLSRDEPAATTLRRSKTLKLCRATTTADRGVGLGPQRRRARSGRRESGRIATSDDGLLPRWSAEGTSL